LGILSSVRGGGNEDEEKAILGLNENLLSTPVVVKQDRFQRFNYRIYRNPYAQLMMQLKRFYDENQEDIRRVNNTRWNMVSKLASYHEDIEVVLDMNLVTQVLLEMSGLLFGIWSHLDIKTTRKLATSERSYWFCIFVFDKILNQLYNKHYDHFFKDEKLIFYTASQVALEFLRCCNIRGPNLHPLNIITIEQIDEVDDMTYRNLGWFARIEFKSVRFVVKNKISDYLYNKWLMKELYDELYFQSPCCKLATYILL